MRSRKHPSVAVLLATYNGSQYIERQIRSLKENSTPFTLHWLDDHSTDNTREVVRSVVRSCCIDLTEWQQPAHLGLPSTFFQLVEAADADIYLFCDQDDIWQPGKIDATVATLLPDLELPAICFSDPFVFDTDTPECRYQMLDVLRAKPEAAMQESRVFTPMVGYGHTQGFTRALREIYIKHKDIARAHAFMHDMWMYAIAAASGTARLMSNVPTTLYRIHGRNTSGYYGGWKGKGIGRMTTTWQEHHKLRRGLSRHAKGFLLASPTLPASPKLDRLLEIARLVAVLDRRQSPGSAVRLARRRILWPNSRLDLELALNCLCSDATA